MTAKRNAQLTIGITLQGERIVLRCTKQSLLDQGFLHTNRAVLTPDLSPILTHWAPQPPQAAVYNPDSDCGAPA